MVPGPGWGPAAPNLGEEGIVRLLLNGLWEHGSQGVRGLIHTGPLSTSPPHFGREAGVRNVCEQRRRVKKHGLRGGIDHNSSGTLAVLLTLDSQPSRNPESVVQKATTKQSELMDAKPCPQSCPSPTPFHLGNCQAVPRVVRPRYPQSTQS